MSIIEKILFILCTYSTSYTQNYFILLFRFLQNRNNVFVGIILLLLIFYLVSIYLKSIFYIGNTNDDT